MVFEWHSENPMGCQLPRSLEAQAESHTKHAVALLRELVCAVLNKYSMSNGITRLSVFA